MIHVILIVLAALAALIVLIFVLRGWFIVGIKQCAAVTAFGTFKRPAATGLRWKWPWQTVEVVSLSGRQISLIVESKTSDDNYVTLSICLHVRHKALDQTLYQGVHTQMDSMAQVKSFVAAAILGYVPTKTFNELLVDPLGIATKVRERLTTELHKICYEIDDVLVTDIEPDEKVKTIMNEKVVAAREKDVAAFRADTQIALLKKISEAETDVRKVQGRDFAEQRKAVVERLLTSIEQLQQTFKAAPSKEVTAQIGQYFDILTKLLSECDKSEAKPIDPRGVSSTLSK